MADPEFVDAPSPEFVDAPAPGTQMMASHTTPASTYQPRAAHGLLEAYQSGVQGSVTGLVARGRMPDIVLDAHHAKWYDKLAAGVGQLVGDAPAMIAGATGGGVAGGAAGSVVPVIGNVAGAAVGAGAGAMAMPTAIREGLMMAYQRGDIASSGDWLNRVGIAIKHTGKDALVGGLTAGVGGKVGKLVAPLAESGVTGRIVAGGAVAGSEIGTMTVAPALLDQRLPEPDEFVNAAIMVAGMKGAGLAASRLRATYAKTGIEPIQAVADAKADPTIAEDLKAPEPVAAPAEGGAASKPVVEQTAHEDIPRAYRPLAAAQAAADAFPEAKARQVLDQPFAKVPDEKAPYQINMNYINGPDDVRSLFARIDEVTQGDIKAVPWAEERAQASRLVEMMGEDPAKADEVLMPFKDLTARMDVVRNILMEAANDAGTKVREWRAAGDAATPQQQADALEALHKMGMVQATVKGNANELARAMNYMKAMKEVSEKGDAYSKLVDLYGEGDPKELLAHASQLDSPEGLARFAAGLNKATRWGQVLEFWKGSVLGPLAVGKKVTSDLAMTVYQPVIDEVSWGWSKMLGRAAEQSGVRGAARVVGNIRAASDALTQSLAKLRAEGPVQGPKTMAADIFFNGNPGGRMGNRQQIPGVGGKLIRTPFSVLNFVTEYFKNLQMSGEAYAKSADAVAKDGFDPGSREFWQEVSARAQNPSEALIDHLEDFGRRMTFGEKGGPIQKQLNKLIEVAPGLEFIIPFRKAPTNVIKQQIRLSPLAPFSETWRAELKAGGERQARALAEMTVGTALTALAFSWAASGRISGAGDPDPAKRATAMAAGWQPHSIKVGDSWYSFGKTHPTGLLMGMVADVHDAWGYMDQGERDKALQAIQRSAAAAIKEQPFLQGMENAAEMIAGAEGKNMRAVQNFVSGFVPMGGTLSAAAAAMDPHRREVDSVLDAVYNKIPGLRQMLPAQRDVFGNEVPEPDRVLGLSPIKATSQTQDPVYSEAARLGVGTPKVPKSVNLPAAGERDLGKVALTPEQRDYFGSASGKMAYQILSNYVGTASWNSLPDKVQKDIYERIISHSRSYAEKTALTPEQRMAESDRIVSEIEKRMAAPHKR